MDPVPSAASWKELPGPPASFLAGLGPPSLIPVLGSPGRASSARGPGDDAQLFSLYLLGKGGRLVGVAHAANAQGYWPAWCYPAAVGQ